MKKLIALCSFVFLLCSCAGVNVKQPDIGNVKKVAILSVTGSEEYEDIEVVKGKKETLLSVVGNIIKDNVEMINEPQVNIATHGANALFQVSVSFVLVLLSLATIPISPQARVSTSVCFLPFII